MNGRAFFLLSAIALVAGASTLAAQSVCPDNLAGAAPGTRLTCRCEAAQTAAGAVWGTDRYTADSSLCRAAVHAGEIGEEGGNVTAYVMGGCTLFRSDLRRGISSGDWGAYDTTFAFDRDVACVGTASAGIAECPRTGMDVRGREPACGLVCHCSPAAMTGSVWGDRLYTSDSSICAAARHAGAVPAQGGPIAVFPGGRCESFKGVSRNDVTSANWGPYDTTFAFEFPLPRCSR